MAMIDYEVYKQEKQIKEELLAALEEYLACTPEYKGGGLAAIKRDKAMQAIAKARGQQ